MRNLLLVGNSHLVAVSDAASGRDRATEERDSTEFLWHSSGFESQRVDLVDEASGEPAALHVTLIGAWRPPLVADGAGEPILADELLAELRAGADALGRVDQVVSYLAGTEHAIFSLVEHPTPFDLVLDADDVPAASDGSRQIVPVDVVRRELRRRIDDTVACCRALRAAFPDADLVHLLPPPPIADDEYVRSKAEVFAQVVQEHGVAPAELRRKIYRLYAEVVHDALGELGVRVLDPPDAAHDDGYLRPELWFEANHANHRYGRLVLDQLGVR